ncbi:MAG: cell division protein SepF [Lachnospiraceae bacterium]|nr:cell division protein SepF [Lachnospiraceae bacterium]
MLEDLINRVIGGKEEYEDEDDVIEEDGIVYSSNKKSEGAKKQLRNRVTKDGNYIMVSTPSKLDDAQKIIDKLMDGHSIVINLSNVDAGMKQRIIDMVIGYSCGSKCNIKKVTENIFIVSNLDIQMIKE